MARFCIEFWSCVPKLIIESISFSIDFPLLPFFKVSDQLIRQLGMLQSQLRILAQENLPPEFYEMRFSLRLRDSCLMISHESWCEHSAVTSQIVAMRYETIVSLLTILKLHQFIT
jgi:hypothetical protein